MADQAAESITQESCQVCEKIIRVLRLETDIEMITLGGPEILQPTTSCDRHQPLIASALSLSAYELLHVASFVQVVQIHRNPLNMSSIISGRPPDEAMKYPRFGMYLVTKPQDSGQSISGRILDPQWIDTDLLGQWKSNCDNLHQGLCKSFPSTIFSSIRPIWLVDVARRCLVIAPDDCSYVALSYVWGATQSLETNTANLRSLQQVGSLSVENTTVPIAKTIRDALGVVKLLNERYLWVDSLCIVQDDEKTKHTEMSKMAAIYANASVTILAIQGSNADSGLQGFRGLSEPRNVSQTVHYLGRGVTLIQTAIDGHTLELRTGEPSWERRGWTYQEQIFSRRRLAFDSGSIRWECEGAIWREHVEASPRIDTYHNAVIRHQVLFRPMIPDLSMLQSLLSNYNNRDLTYPEDALNAFAGIAYICSPAFAGGFISGLPTAIFDVALLWQPESAKFRRRIAKIQNTNYCLPSWSWAGWAGPVHMQCASAADFLKRTPTGEANALNCHIKRHLHWKYHESIDSVGTPIHTSVLNDKDAWLKGNISVTSGWSRYPASENLRSPNWPPDLKPNFSHFYTHNTHPGYEFWYPISMIEANDASPGILAPYLSTRTRRGWLYAKTESVSSTVDRPVLVVRGQRGSYAGVVFPDDAIEGQKEALEAPANRIELVEIATGAFKDVPNSWAGLPEYYHTERPRTSGWYNYFWVLWVGWHRGVAYRKGIGRVNEAIWKKERGERFDFMIG